VALGHPARDGEARLSFGALRGRSDGSARRRQALPEETSVPVPSHRNYRRSNAAGQGAEESAEAVVAPPGEGLNL